MLIILSSLPYIRCLDGHCHFWAILPFNAEIYLPVDFQNLRQIWLLICNFNTMLASDYVETIVSEMNPRCGNFVSCWLGLWQTYPGPKITGKHCVDRSFITLLYSPSILSIDSEETDCSVWIKSGISLLMLESQHVLFTYSKAEIF